MSNEKIEQAEIEEQPVLSLAEETTEAEPVVEVVEKVKEEPEPEPEPVIEVKPEMEPELKPTKFVVKVGGKYLFKWSGKVFVSDIQNAKVFNKANAEYFQKEIKAEIIPVG